MFNFSVWFPDNDPDFEAVGLDDDVSGPEAEDQADDGDWTEVRKPEMTRSRSKSRSKRPNADQKEKKKKRIGSKNYFLGLFLEAFVVLKCYSKMFKNLQLVVEKRFSHSLW